MPLARNISYATGALALTLLIVSGFLLAFIRDKQRVVTITTPSPNPATSKVVPPAVPLTEMKKTGEFSQENFIVLVSPVASVGDTSVTVTGADTTPVFPPGVVPFESTRGMPLQSPSEGYGYCAMIPSGQQFFTSIQNGLAIFGQYFSSEIDMETKFRPITNVYGAQDGFRNTIVFNCPQDDGSMSLPTVNADASAVGTVGHFSIATSRDGSRFYIAYRQPFMGSAATSQLFPFLQLIGRVAVYTRPLDNTTPGSTSASGQLWDYSCALSVQNPFGSQVGGFDNLCDPITRLQLSSDDFGSIIRTSKNLQNDRRVLAVRANYGYVKENGAMIAIYEENENNMQNTTGVIQLWDFYKPGFDPNNPATTGWTLDEKLVFGKNFDMGDNTLLAAVRIPAEGCFGAMPTPVNVVAYFKRNETTKQWDFKHFIDSPDKTEDFGVSISVCPDGAMALIGAPKFPTGFGGTNTPGIGGSVYVYVRSPDGETWSMNQKFLDPFASTHQSGAFGYWLSVDPQFLMVGISANQNNVLGQQPPVVGSNPPLPKPSVVFASINQEVGMLFGSPNMQEVVQPTIGTAGATAFVDPTFGANMALAFEDGDGQNQLRVCANSPLNQLVDVYVTSGT